MNSEFIYTTQCELAIVSDEFDPDLITKELNIEPARSFKKGEQSISKHSGSIITKPHNLWALKSKSFKSEEETIKPHIDYLKSLLQPKLDVLKRYKRDSRFEVSIWIWVETNNSGMGLELDEDQLAFLGAISNRIHFSLITKK
jgi:hypothetical protein